jgi:hypothetical protein
LVQQLAKMRDELATLADRTISMQQLMMVRQVAQSLRLGFFSAEEAQRVVSHMSPKFDGIFDSAAPQDNREAAAVLVTDAIETILKIRQM